MLYSVEAGFIVREYSDPRVVFVFVTGDIYGDWFCSRDGVGFLLTGRIDECGGA